MKALGKVGLMIVLTLSLIYALGQAVAQPVLSVSPNPIVFQAEVGSPAAQAQSLRIANLMPATTLTWTLSISPSGNFQPIVTPLRGSGDATAIVQVDSSGIYAAGIYTAYVLIDVETADNSPTTIPIVLEASHPQSAVARAQAAARAALRPAQLQFGLAFISSPEAPAGEVRYARAASLGARLNRWPMYWYTIETDPVHQPLVFDGSHKDPCSYSHKYFCSYSCTCDVGDHQ